MKTQNIILVIAFLFLSLVTTAQAKQETVKVYGNCGMCKSHIEKAAMQAGATSAVWNKNTKFLTLKFDASKTDSKKIQEKVADAGYDTQDATSNKEAYDNLDECCKYERKVATKTTSINNAKNCCSDMASCTKTTGTTCDKCKDCSKDCCKNGCAKSCCKSTTTSNTASDKSTHQQIKLVATTSVNACTVENTAYCCVK